MPVSVLLVLLVSGCVGFVSGLVGVGGGFIMTPALIFMGVPAPVDRGDIVLRDNDTDKA